MQRRSHFQVLGTEDFYIRFSSVNSTHNRERIEDVSERVLSLVFCKKNGKCKIHEQNEVAYDGQFLALYVVFPVYFLKSRKCFHIFFLFTSCYGNDILPLYAYFYCISLDLIIISVTNSDIRMIRGFLHKIFMIISLGKRRNKRSEEYVLF